MGLGFDLVEASARERRILRQQRENGGQGPAPVVVNKGPGFSMGGPPANKEKKDDEPTKETTPTIDENTTEISNIVYTRDPAIINEQTGLVDVEEAFSHKNYLNVKYLCQKKELMNVGDEQSPAAKQL